jgi:hypothetical protein
MANGSRLARIGASLGALVLISACAGTPRGATSASPGTTAAPSTGLAAAEGSAPSPGAVERASGRVCRDRQSTGRLLPRRVCTTPRQDRFDDEAAREQMHNSVAGAPITGG